MFPLFVFPEDDSEKSPEEVSENVKETEGREEDPENNSEVSAEKIPEKAVESSANAVVYTKDEFIEKFIEKSGITDSFKYGIEMAEADYDWVKAQYFPQFKVVFGVGPHPKCIYEQAEIITGDDGEPVFKDSKWHKYYDDYGIAVRLSTQFVLPVYTFGRVRYGKEAAKAQIEVKKAEAEISDLKIRKEAAAFYWSWVMAENYRSILEPAIEELNKAEEKIKDMLYEEKEGVTQKDLKKLQVEKEKILYFSDKLKFQSDTLKELITEVLGENWKFADTEMTQQSFGKEYEELVGSMKEKSPYAAYLQKGVYAYEKLYDLEIRQALPIFGIAGSYSFRYTSSVDERTCPEANNPYNGYDGEIGISISFDLNILAQVRKIQKAKAQWNLMKSQALFLEKNVPIQVKKQYNDLKMLDSRISHLKAIRKMTKGMMTSEYANYESNLSEGTKDLVDAVKAFYENEQEYIQAVYEYNMKVEEIIEFTGTR